MTSRDDVISLRAQQDQLSAEFERTRKLVLIALLVALLAVFIVEVRT